MVGAVKQEFLQHAGVAGDKARAHARHIGALDKLVNITRLAKVIAGPKRGGGFQPPSGGASK